LISLLLLSVGGALLVDQGGEEVLYKNKVDIVLTGHEHTYERTYPVYNHTQQDGAPIYLLQGGSGNREGNNGNYPPLSELPSWVAATYNQIGFGLLTQSGDGKEISWKFIESSTKNVLDSVSWVKK
jgi:acid phosphatase type 7